MSKFRSLGGGEFNDAQRPRKHLIDLPVGYVDEAEKADFSAPSTDIADKYHVEPPVEQPRRKRWLKLVMTRGLLYLIAAIAAYGVYQVVLTYEADLSERLALSPVTTTMQDDAAAADESIAQTTSEAVAEVAPIITEPTTPEDLVEAEVTAPSVPVIATPETTADAVPEQSGIDDPAEALESAPEVAAIAPSDEASPATASEIPVSTAEPEVETAALAPIEPAVEEPSVEEPSVEEVTPPEPILGSVIEGQTDNLVVRLDNVSPDQSPSPLSRPAPAIEIAEVDIDDRFPSIVVEEGEAVIPRPVIPKVGPSNVAPQFAPSPPARPR